MKSKQINEKRLFENEIENNAPIRLVDTNELARILSLSPWTIRKWKVENKIPFIQLGRSIRYNLKDVFDSLNLGDSYGPKD